MNLFVYLTSKLSRSKNSTIEFRENSPLYVSNYSKTLPITGLLFFILTITLSVYPLVIANAIGYSCLLFFWLLNLYAIYAMSFSLRIYDTNRIKIRRFFPFPKSTTYSISELKYIETRWKIKGKPFFYFLTFENHNDKNKQKIPLIFLLNHEAIFHFLTEKRAVPFFTNRYYVRDYWNGHWDVILLWSYVAICYLYPFFYGFQIFLLILFPLLRYVYRRIYDIPRYKKHNKKTRYNIRAFWIMVLFSIFLPAADYDLPLDLYQKNLQFNCIVLSTYSNEYMIEYYPRWVRTGESMQNLVNQIQRCNLKDKTPFLLHLLKEPHRYDTFFQPYMGSVLDYYPYTYMVRIALEKMYQQKFPALDQNFSTQYNYNMTFDVSAAFNEIDNEVLDAYNNYQVQP